MKLALRAIAIISFVAAIVWMITSPGIETLLVFLTGNTTLLTSFTIDKIKNEFEPFNQYNRRMMLNHVENFWVKGVLEKSLHGAALLELGVKENLSAVHYPWEIKRESTDEILPRGKSIIEVFQDIGLGRSLLILGASGSGKTTLLLDLTRQLIERARLDPTEPIPVVFNLSSWSEKQGLVDWLIDQLYIFYKVPKKVGQSWIDNNKMFLLLDGLDEVGKDKRSACIDIVNKFREHHSLSPFVVCSRIEEYTSINNPLELEGAITIQPLTPVQVNAYFNMFGDSGIELKRLLEQDESLQELAKTPLMLSIMLLTYQKAIRTRTQFPESQNVDSLRKFLLGSYIERMFERLSGSKRNQFSKANTLRWLSWLARKMIQHNQTFFMIEQIQPTWLNDKKQYRSYVNKVTLDPIRKSG